jgi:hypothetical protein
MTTTLAALTTTCRAALRDSSATPVFSATEIGDAIGRGIVAIDGLYPKEIIGSVAISASVYTYAIPTGMDTCFRVELYNSDGTFDNPIPEGDSTPNSGWQIHASTLFVPAWSYTSGQTLRVWGYGPWAYIDSSSSSSATTDLDRIGLAAIPVFVRLAIYEELMVDRAKFAQYEAIPGANDATLLGILQLKESARRDWAQEVSRLRTMRKTG